MLMYPSGKGFLTAKADWFLKQEGRWSFSESLFLLRQWSQYTLAENIVQGETLIWDAGAGLKEGDQRRVTFTARRVPD